MRLTQAKLMMSNHHSLSTSKTSNPSLQKSSSLSNQPSLKHSSNYLLASLPLQEDQPKAKSVQRKNQSRLLSCFPLTCAPRSSVWDPLNEAHPINVSQPECQQAIAERDPPQDHALRTSNNLTKKRKIRQRLTKRRQMLPRSKRKRQFKRLVKRTTKCSTILKRRW